MPDLADKSIVITGGSSGIGAATAIECARAGMDCVLVARRRDRLAEVAAEVARLGRRAELVACDIADPRSSEAILDAAERAFGGFHAVFANAGYGLERDVLATPIDEMRRMFEVNFFSGADLLQQAARRLIAAERPGHLLMCSSCVAKFTLPRHGAYSATKAAQAMVARAMRSELAHHGIEVSTVHPVTTTTEFFEVAAGEDRRHLRNGIPPHVPALFVQKPDRIGKAVVRCLRRPHPEVWTSHVVRLVAGAFTAFPSLQEWVMRGEARKYRARDARTSASKPGPDAKNAGPAGESSGG
ncbi:MAG: SDR family NAD(P)-dependent oxidoreductase [Phycisphaerae bacterium]|nr:SDR family NAD(P)-dependent oxidoreductase [Phycisphaerae bacterium]